MTKAKTSRKVVITCAVTGSVHTPTMSPYLPITPDQIASEAIAAAEAGASILHLHARNPEDGRPSADPALFMQFLPRIKQSTDAVVNISTGGSSLMALEDRLAASLRAEPEMCSLNMGSMNFALFPALDKPTEWKHEWEPELLEATRSSIFKNTFADMEFILTRLGQGCGTRFECRLGGGCWCNDVDARLPLPAAGEGEDCLCQDCLRAAALAAAAATTGQR